MDERTDSRAILRDAAKWPLLTGCECISDLILRSAPSRQRTCAVRCARLEGWPRVRTLRPSFETLASQAPQDEVSILQRLERRDDAEIVEIAEFVMTPRLDGTG